MNAQICWSIEEMGTEKGKGTRVRDGNFSTSAAVVAADGWYSDFTFHPLHHHQPIIIIIISYFVHHFVMFC